MVKIIFSKNRYRVLRIYEAILFSVPFSIELLVYRYPLEGLLLPLVLCFSTFIKTPTNYDFVLPTPFARYPFEYITGFRKTWPIILLSYVICIIAISVSNFNLAVFGMAVMILTMTAFFTKPEDVFFVWINNSSPLIFLRKKLFTTILYSLLLTLPISVFISLFFPGNWLVLLSITILGFTLPVTSMLNKYAYFPQDSEIISGLLIGLCILFPPLFIVLIPYLAGKASVNLKSYL